jgi:hypothetical protein
VKLRRQVGFWGTVGNLRIGQLVFAPEFAPALLLGVGGGIWLLATTSQADRVQVAEDYLIVLGPFIGLVLAGLTLVITLMSDKYLRLLSTGSGVIAFLRPFILAIGIQVGTLIGGVAYRAASDELPLRAEQVFFVALSFAFVFGVLEVVAITRNLLAHAVLRAEQVATEDAEQRVAQLPARRTQPR